MEFVKQSVQRIINNTNRTEPALVEEILKNEEYVSLYFIQLLDTEYFTNYLIVSVIEKLNIQNIIKILLSKFIHYTVNIECIKHIIILDKTGEVIKELQSLFVTINNIKYLYNTLELEDENINPVEDTNIVLYNKNIIQLNNIDDSKIMIFYIFMVMMLKNKGIKVNPYSDNFLQYTNIKNVIFLYKSFNLEISEKFNFKFSNINTLSTFLYLITNNQSTDNLTKSMEYYIYNNLSKSKYFLFKFLNAGYHNIQNIYIYMLNGNLTDYNNIAYNHPLHLTEEILEEDIVKIPSEYLYDIKDNYVEALKVTVNPVIITLQQLVNEVSERNRISIPINLRLRQTNKLKKLIESLHIDSDNFISIFNKQSENFQYFNISNISIKKIYLHEIKYNKDMFVIKVLRTLLDDHYLELLGFDFKTLKECNITELINQLYGPYIIDLILDNPTNDNIINLSPYIITHSEYIKRIINLNPQKQNSYKLINNILDIK